MRTEKHDILDWPAGRLDFSPGCIIMGVLNVTPDSFSDGGQFLDTKKAIEHGLKMADEGAAIIDIGAESTRPGSASVSAEEQIKRAIPVIKALAERIDVPISIDTYNVKVAKAALDAGAAMINDITALADERLGQLAAERLVPVVLMHMQGTPKTMQTEPKYKNVVSEVLEFLLHNLLLLKNIDKFIETGYRILVGTSRKSFIGKITGKENPAQRLFGTAATVALCAAAGVSVVRVHDVAEMLEVVKVANTVNFNRY